MLGAVVDARPESRVAAAASRVSEQGGTPEIDLSPPVAGRRAPQSVIARLGPLGDGFVVVEASDTSGGRAARGGAPRLRRERRPRAQDPGGGDGASSPRRSSAPTTPTRSPGSPAKIQHESRRLGSLVTELIELSRLQGADPLPELEPVAVDDVVREAVNRVRVSAETAGTELTLDAPSGLEVGRQLHAAGHGAEQPAGERGRLLLAGIVGVGPPAPRRAHRRDLGDRPGDRDPPEHQERVFERFFRVDPARSRATGGTGLGLAIVKHVAANHGGEVRLWSEPGVGSTFTLQLPTPGRPGAGSVPSSGAPARRRCARRPPTGPPPAPGRPRDERSRPMTRVLIVEDEESLADPLAYLLRKEGFEASVAGTGAAALDDFERHGADIVLLDLMLPGMSGTDVCKALRQRSSVPVIMVTARDAEIDKVVGLELGADDYVTKPYSARELIARVRAVLRRGQEADGAGDGGPAGAPSDRQVLEAGPVRMDVGRHVVTVEHGGTSSEIALPLKEFDLLEYLMRNVGRVLTRAQLIDRVWGADYVGDTKTLDVHIKRLRAKLEPEPSQPRHLLTVRGLGYKLDA